MSRRRSGCLIRKRATVGNVKQVELAGEHAVADMRTMLERLIRAEAPDVRVVAGDDRMSVFSSTLYPTGLTDTTPLILVHRGFPARTAETFDVVVEARALLDRLPRLTEPPYSLPMPPVELTAVWAGMLPPRSGWDRAGVVDVRSLERVAREGVERIQAMLPQDPGQAMVHRARRDVWALPMLPGVPAGAAFALEMMGFLRGEERVRIHRSRSWVRLASTLGDVFVRS